MDWGAIKVYLLQALKRYLTKDGFKKTIVSLLLSYLGVGGFKGLAAKYILGKGVQFGLWLVEDTIEKAVDKEIKNDYADEMSKGKDADEQKKIDGQLDIINGPR